LKWRRGSIQSVPRQQDLREARAWRSCGEPIKDLNVLRFFCVGAAILGFSTGRSVITAAYGRMNELP
jgi:hypothetical protein